MRILVTGSSGFIGQHVVKKLAKVPSVDEIVCLDVRTFPDLVLPDVRIVRQVGDVRDREACIRASEGASAVIHLAAVASVPASIADPVGTNEINATGTVNVLEGARINRVRQVSVASSSAVYGESEVRSKHENLPPYFLSPYAASKMATEAYALAYRSSYDMAVTAFRFFNVFGPGQKADHPYAAVIPKFLAAIRENQNLVVFGDGTQTRDFVSVNTVADALVKASVRELSSDSAINIAAGYSMSLNHLIELLSRIHGSDLPVTFAPVRAGDILHSGAEIGRLKKLIPDLEFIGIETALESVYRWYIDT